MRVVVRRVAIVLAAMIPVGVVVSDMVLAALGYASRQIYSNDDDPTPSTPAQRTPDHLRVLFIGNSFTNWNGGVPRLVKALSLAARVDRPLIADSVTSDGASLQLHWNHGRAETRIAEGNWDIIVLQDHSQQPIKASKSFDEYVTRFDAQVHAQKASTMLFMTWARLDEPFNTQVLSQAYTSLGRSLGAQVAPVGLAWAAARQEDPRVPLHFLDKKHPTPAGTYLTACVFYVMFYHRSPEGLPGDFSGPNGQDVAISLKPDVAGFLQRVAYRTVMSYVGAQPQPASAPSTMP